MAPEFAPFTPCALTNRRYFWKEDGKIECASLGRNTTARFSTSNILFSRALLIYSRPQPVVFRNVLLIAILVILACLRESRQTGQLIMPYTMPRDDIMAIIANDDDLLFRASSHFHTPQQGDVTSHDISLIHTLPIFGTFDRSSDNRSRPRYHFLKDNLSEPSELSPPPLVDGKRAAAQTSLHITSITENEIKIIFVPPNNRQSPNNNSASPSRTQIDFWQDLRNQIHHGLLVNISNPSVQQQVNVVIATLQTPTTNPRSEKSSAMEHDVRTGQGNPHRDTYRYGREGWPIVDSEDPAAERPASIPGSSFRVPYSTLNLFQSVDLFAPPPPRRSALDQIIEVNVRTAGYLQYIRDVLNARVAAAHSGRHVAPGWLFALSMEASRVNQLMNILTMEYNETVRAQRAATRSTSNATGNEHTHERWSNDDINDSAQPTWTDDDSSDSESGEPEGWANLDFVFDGEFPHEVCFHIGTQQVTFPIEVVENWMMNARNWDRLESRNAEFSQRHPERGLETGRQERIHHTFARPENVRSRWPIVPTTGYEDSDDTSEEEESDYGSRETRQLEPVSFWSDTTDSEIEDGQSD